ncbi:hypothetical protein V491_02873 [Pseudogymnoascus sp. VKM F-3775]|nr:hypothetical protein V491_02873 [Pseudogymnoascus sp. VKM F-3775]
MVSSSGGSNGTQTSSNRFSRAKLSSLTPLITKQKDDTKAGERKRFSSHSPARQGSPMGRDSQLDGSLASGSGATQISSSTRQRLHRYRPGSTFGSLGRKSILSVDEASVASSEAMEKSSIDVSSEEMAFAFHKDGQKLLYHGQVQTTIGLFRKKKEYLALTDTHLIRFKSLSRALEAFPTISRANRRYSGTRHSSTASVGSLHEIQSLNSRSSSDGDNGILLNQIVAAYRVEGGRPYFITEVVYLDEATSSVGLIQLMLQDPREADLWHTSIRAAAQKAKLVADEPFPPRTISYIRRLLEASQDYDENYFKIYRVVRRPANKAPGKSSEDFSKLSSTACYLVIGINLLHLISLPDFHESPSRPMNVKATKSSYGLVSLVTMEINNSDDTLELGFRTPLEKAVTISLAASQGPEIGRNIFRSILYLKPQWLDYTFLYSGPKEVLDDSDVDFGPVEDNGAFDRTLIAYCLAYGCSPNNIRYTIGYEDEDSPEFILLPPFESRRYSTHELLAIFRALRYNESFRSMSFAGIDLECLHGTVDEYGKDHIALKSRSGIPIRKYFDIDPDGRSLLYQEVQALALKTYKTRKLNFGDTLPRRRPRDTYEEEEGTPKDPGCEIAAAILPLCRGQLTNVDWIVFSGIELGETDLEEIAPALHERLCRFRSFEVARCGLTDRGLQVFLNNLEKQNATLECINIADNPGRLNLADFPITMSRFSQIRKLDLSRVTSTSGDEPLIAAEVMLAWRLQELVLTGVPINDQTLDAISTYLHSDMSNSLHLLQMDQCNLTGTQVAVLMRTMCHVPGEGRDMQLHISANRLEKGNSDIASAIKDCLTPSHVTMRMVEYQSEVHFRQLLEALRENTTIKCLDISKASLPYDAGEDTCIALQRVFEENTTLEELDISGEYAHLEIARFGIGLNHALTGLKKNNALKVLKLEYQNLGLEGANTLSSVIEANDTITHIYCEHNNINLQGFTVLVNALANNFTVLSLPLMQDDQNEAVKRMRQIISEAHSAAKGESGAKHAVRKTLTTLGVHIKENPVPTAQDIDQAIQILNSKWAKQKERLVGLLQRNLNIAQGLETRSMYEDNPEMSKLMRPTTAGSDSVIMDAVMRNTTPRFERVSHTDGYFDRISTDDNPRADGSPVAKPHKRERSLSELTAKLGVFDFEVSDD